MRVLVWTEDPENVIVLVDRLTEIAALLFIPPVTIRVTKLTLYWGRVDVAAVLRGRWSAKGIHRVLGEGRRGQTMSGSSTSAWVRHRTCIREETGLRR